MIHAAAAIFCFRHAMPSLRYAAWPLISCPPRYYALADERHAAAAYADAY